MGWRTTRSRDALILLIMEHEDEIRRLCIETRLLRSQALMVAGQVAMIRCRMKQSLAERERLRKWSAELRSGGRHGRPVPPGWSDGPALEDARLNRKAEVSTRFQAHTSEMVQEGSAALIQGRSSSSRSSSIRLRG